MSSIVRRLYYHHHHTPLPRVLVGVMDSWDWSMAISGLDTSSYDTSFSVAWSLCGQFIARLTEDIVEIWDPLTFQLLSTLQPTEPTSQLVGLPAYSPDGHSLACTSDAAIIIWDIQTGGVAKEIQHILSPEFPPEQLFCGWLDEVPLVWSSDARLIGTILSDQGAHMWFILRYDVTSGTALPPIMLQSEDKPWLWAHNESFWVMTTVWGERACTINISEVGCSLAKIKSFSIQLEDNNYRIKSFSPAVYRISILGHHQLCILDIQKSGSLLDKEGDFHSHSFSSDGGHFAASLKGYIHIWKYKNSHYIPWRKFPSRALACSELLFSPTSPLILGIFEETLKLWHWSGPSITSKTDSQQLSIVSSSGAYVTTANYEESTITITKTPSQTPSQFIDTGMMITALALIGNVLLAVDSQVAMGWLLTEEGLVNNVLGDRRASRGDSIWVTPLGGLDFTSFLLQDQAGVSGPCIYATWDTEVGVPQEPWYPFWFIYRGWHHLYNRFVHGAFPKDNWKLSEITLEEGWVKDRDGQHLLWLPIDWEMGMGITDGQDGEIVGWFPDIPTIQFESPGRYSIIVKP